MTAPGDAATLHLTRPGGIAVDDTGGLLIADSGGHRIVRVDVVTGAVTPVMGTGVAGNNGDTNLATATQLDEPSSIVFLPFSLIAAFEPSVPDNGGLLVVAERGGHRIRATVAGLVFTLAGDGEAGDTDNADGLLARFTHPRGLMLAPPSADLQALRFFIVDAVDRVRAMDLTVAIGGAGFALQTTVTTAIDGTGGLASRDDGDRSRALFKSPTALTFIGEDQLIVVDNLTGRLRLVTPSTTGVSTVSGMPDGTVASAASTPAATTEPMVEPAGVALDTGVDPPVLYVSEAGRARLRRFELVDPAAPATWTTSTMVLDVPLVRPAGLSIDVVGRRLYLADQGAHAVYGIDLDTIAVVAGSGAGENGDVVNVALGTVVAGVPGRRGAAGDDGPAALALLNEPEGVAFMTGPGTNGDDGRFLLVADTGNNRVRRLQLGDASDDDTIIQTVLGDGDAASGGEGAPSNAFPVQGPRGLAVDAAGNLLVTSGNAIRFVQAGDNGLPDGTDDVRTIYGKPPRQAFPDSVTRCLSDITLSPSTKGGSTVAHALDACLGVIVRLDPGPAQP